jgi:hypothetical protein
VTCKNTRSIAGHFPHTKQNSVLRGPSRRARGTSQQVTAGHFKNMHVQVTSPCREKNSVRIIAPGRL